MSENGSRWNVDDFDTGLGFLREPLGVIRYWSGSCVPKTDSGAIRDVDFIVELVREIEKLQTENIRLEDELDFAHFADAMYPEKANAPWHRRRALKQQAKTEHYDFRAICDHYNNKCLKCGRNDVKLTVDHIKPLSKGGHDTGSNIQPLCHSCNATKHTKYIDYRPDTGLLRWLQKRLF